MEQGTRNDEKERELEGEGGRVRGEEKGSRTEKDRREGAMWAKELFETERFAMRKTGSPKNSRSSTNSLLKTLNSRL